MKLVIFSQRSDFTLHKYMHFFFKTGLLQKKHFLPAICQLLYIYILLKTYEKSINVSFDPFNVSLLNKKK